MSKLVPTPRSITTALSFDGFEEDEEVALSRSLPDDCCTMQCLNDYCHFYCPPAVRERYCLKELDRLFHHPKLITIMRSQEDHSLLQHFLDHVSRSHITPTEWFTANGKYHASSGSLCILQSDFALNLRSIAPSSLWSEFNTKHLFRILTSGESTEIMTMNQFLLALKKGTQNTEQIWKLNSTADVIRKLQQIMSEQRTCISDIHKQLTPSATKKLQQLHELQVKHHQVSPRAYITNTELNRILAHLLHQLRLQQGSTVAFEDVHFRASSDENAVTKVLVEIPKVEFTVFSPTDFNGKEQFFSEEIKSVISADPQHAAIMPSHDPNVFELTNGQHRKWSYSDLTAECNRYEVAAKDALNRRLFLHIDTSDSTSSLSSFPSPLTSSRSRVSSAVGQQPRKSLASLPSIITSSSPSRANSIMSNINERSRASSAQGTRVRRCSSPLPAVYTNHISGDAMRRDLLRRSLT